MTTPGTADRSADDGTVVDAPSWVVVVPVKLLSTAKSRLRTVSAPDRARLALAMALDSMSAALACPAVLAVVVVTDDPVAASAASALGATVVPDQPDAGLNAALAHGAEQARAGWPTCAVAALAADVPATRPDELATALTAAATHDRAVVADVGGKGTVLLTARSGVELAPSFGPLSLQRHTDAGARELAAPVPGLRRDVDTVEDLHAALALGCGPLTTVAIHDIDVRADEVSELHGTVSDHSSRTGAGTVVLDDGTTLDYPREALDRGGLRLLHAGQRVRMEVSGHGSERQVARLTIATLDWPTG